MGAQNRLMALAPYNIGFHTVNGTVAVQITYPKGWKVLEPDHDNIKFAPSGNAHVYWIDNSLDIDPILDAIEETVEVNKDMEARVALLAEKVNELKQLFIDKTLDELKTLEFTFKKPATTKKTNTKAKETPKETAKTTQTPAPMEVKFEKKEKTVKTAPKNKKPNAEESDIDRKIAAAMGLKMTGEE